MPVEPPATSWQFPHPDTADEHGIVGVGADLDPGTLLAAYRSGVFPMPIDEGGEIAWWSPDPRGVIPLDGLVVSRSLRRSRRRYRVTIDRAFPMVVQACRSEPRDGGWITGSIEAAYGRLHALGWAHSVEVWDEADALVGGLYGVQVAGLFAGESMFHRATDASKVALVVLVEQLKELRVTLLDVQWYTDHLGTLGATAIPRSDYLHLMRGAVMSDDAADLAPIGQRHNIDAES